ncbi:polyamine oxidase Fms1p [Trichomonascus vanleenenianus]|uniref:flavin monoamine oxidase family protein n=1 Tax=Trichomonascus vanleenenianus TaxID=2268995 RepID=UPI003ECB767A
MKDAIVIGAGMSGIAAASELAAKGKDVVVLEARERLGGRLFTDRASGSAPYELGCSWIHESLDNPLLDIAIQNGVDVQYDDRDIAVYDKNGPIDPARELGPAMNEFGSFAALYWEKNASQDDISLKELVEKFIASHPKLTADQKKSLPSLLRLPQLGNGVDWSKVSTKQASPNKGRDLMVVGGYDKVFDAVRGGDLADSQIKLNTAVKSIDSSDPSKVVVTTTSGEKFEAAYVVVTVPIAVLKHGDVEFNPPLSEDLSKAIATSDAAHVGKIYFEFDSAFWNTDTDKFIISADPDAGENGPLSYPLLISNWYKFNGSKKHPGLALLMPPPHTNRFETDPSQAFEFFTPVFKALQVNKDQPLPAATKITASSWTTSPYSRGSYSTFTVGNSRASSIAAFEAGSGRVRFAGEHTIPNGATFAHGAYRSGKREANYILSKL